MATLIAAGSVLVLVLLVVIFRKRNGRTSSKRPNDLGLVSGQWLADHRRSG
jgi:hypothetical protein